MPRPEDDDQRVFDYWLTELRNRESSDVNVVSITTSASLVMLTLFLSFGLQTSFSEKVLVSIGGIGISALGIAYREASLAIMHEHQIVKLKEMMNEKEKMLMAEQKAYAECHSNWIRPLLWRAVYFLPIVLWLVAIGLVFGR